MDKKPQPWPPYARDCSQGYCSYYCPQWCFFFFPSPPPPPPSSSPLFSPLLITVIAVTSTALVLITYYLILARYRAHHQSSGPASPPLDPAFGFLASRNEGLDDNLISMIKTYKYQAGGGLVVDGTDCSVCLSPFEDGDKIRLLSKCKHAFHQCCIDTWLKSHANCPLCRACIFPLQEGQESESESESESEVGRVVLRIDPSSDQIIEIGEGRGVIGRSFSMDSPFRRQMGADTATDINSVRWSCRSLHSVISPMRMKRSRSMTSAVARGRGAILPT